MESVYQNAGIDPKETGYIEAHGTGTKVGDPIEVAALHKVFGEGRSARNPLFIGSVKSNVGHLEAASGKPCVAALYLASDKYRHNFSDQNNHDVRTWFCFAKLRLQEPKRKDPVLQMESKGISAHLKASNNI